MQFRLTSIENFENWNRNSLIDYFSAFGGFMGFTTIAVKTFYQSGASHSVDRMISQELYMVEKSLYSKNKQDQKSSAD